MDNRFEEDEQARSSRRVRKIEEMKREKERQKQQREQLRKYAPIAGGAVCAAIILIVGGVMFVRHGAKQNTNQQSIAQVETTEAS